MTFEACRRAVLYYPRQFSLATYLALLPPPPPLFLEFYLVIVESVESRAKSLFTARHRVFTMMQY